MMLFEKVIGLLVVLGVYLPSVLAETPAASTFYLSEQQTQFSVNVAQDPSNDISILFMSPAYSWVAIGFGAQMKDSLMFVMYPNHDGSNVTISPRLATTHSEPTFIPSISLSIQPGTTITPDGLFVLRAICHNCRVWLNGFLDVKSTAQPMIYAFGPGNKLQSDDLSAPLKRHVRYGHFTMDMLAATGNSSVPEPSATASGVQVLGGMTKDRDRKNLAHAVVGCLALFVLWPLNVLLAGFLKRIGVHVGVSVFILVFLVVSYGLGIATSGEYNRSQSFSSPHQIFAFIALAPLLLLSLLPLLPHTVKISLRIPSLHSPLTTLSFLLLLTTGGLGLHLSSQTLAIKLIYTAISLFTTIFILSLQFCIHRRGSAYARANGRRVIHDDDERDLVLAAYYAERKIRDEERSRSGSSMANHNSHARSGSGNGGIYGGGAMPGPEYLLNMHPGVPVHRSLGA